MIVFNPKNLYDSFTPYASMFCTNINLIPLAVFEDNDFNNRNTES